MDKHDWDLETAKGKEAMAAWLDFMLDSGACDTFDAEDEAYMDAHLPAFQRIVSPTGRISRLKEGKATLDDQQWAACQIEELWQPVPMKRGRPPKDERDKDVMVMLASDEAVRIKELWKKENVKNDAQMAIEYAVRRILRLHDIADNDFESDCCALTDKVADNLNRPKKRRLSWDKVKNFS